MTRPDRSIPSTPSTASRASVTEFKARLSEFLDRARSGGSVLITHRGRPVARLEPVGPEDAPDTIVRYLVALGLARPPAHTLAADFFDRPRVADPDGSVLSALLEDSRTSR